MPTTPTITSMPTNIQELLGENLTAQVLSAESPDQAVESGLHNLLEQRDSVVNDLVELFNNHGDRVGYHYGVVGRGSGGSETHKNTTPFQISIGGKDFSVSMEVNGGIMSIGGSPLPIHLLTLTSVENPNMLCAIEFSKGPRLDAPVGGRGQEYGALTYYQRIPTPENGSVAYKITIGEVRFEQLVVPETVRAERFTNTSNRKGGEPTTDIAGIDPIANIQTIVSAIEENL